jgi:hypothetical protein
MALSTSRSPSDLRHGRVKIEATLEPVPSATADDPALRGFGALKGHIQLSKDFDEPLDHSGNTRRSLNVTRIQIHVPEELVQELKQFARRNEWSLAEAFRRGAELLLATYPEHPESEREWQAPESLDVGWKGLSAEELRDLHE